MEAMPRPPVVLNFLHQPSGRDAGGIAKSFRAHLGQDAQNGVRPILLR